MAKDGSGRERCNLGTAEGRAEYAWRKLLMWIRQDAKCCNCRQQLRFAEATFEHENLRGKDIDERIFVWKNGRWIPQNGVAHAECNVKRGSRRLPLWHGSEFVSDVNEDLAMERS